MGPPAGVGPVEVIYRTIRHADDAVRVCHEQLPAGHLARAKMDDAIIVLHEARRAAEVA